MRILDKYILKEILSPFVFGICAFTSVFIGTGTLFRIAQYVTQYGASVASVTKLFLYSLPSIIVLTFPMSMLLASLLSFGRMSGANEITAMRSGGQSFYRLAAPVFIVAFLVSIFSMVFTEMVVPAANTAYTHTLRYEIQQNTKPKSQDHIIIKNLKQGSIERLIYARKFDESSSTMQAVTVQEFADDRLVRVENAEKAVWENGRWTMYYGIVHDLSPEGRLERTMRFEQQIMPVDKNPAEIAREQKPYWDMTIKELKQHIKALRNEYVQAGLYEVELHQRITIPLASLVFAMIGVPLGLQPHRTSSSIGLGLSIIIIFIYYIIMTTTAALGQGGALPPIVAAWIPNLVGIMVGLYLMRKAAR